MELAKLWKWGDCPRGGGLWWAACSCTLASWVLWCHYVIPRENWRIVLVCHQKNWANSIIDVPRWQIKCGLESQFSSAEKGFLFAGYQIYKYASLSRMGGNWLRAFEYQFRCSFIDFLLSFYVCLCKLWVYFLIMTIHKFISIPTYKGTLK